MTGIPDRIQAAAVAYLAAPGVIFAAGWLEPVPGMLLAGCIIAATLPVMRELAADDQFSPGPGALAWLAALAMVWAGLGGAGHFVFANPDWHTRDAVYGDLIFGNWPPGYGQSDGIPLILRSATGFFLVPAAAAKLAGIGAAHWLLFAWSAIGALLFLLLLPLPGKFGLRLVMLSFVAIGFSGMDYLAILIVHGHAPLFPMPLEWWRPWTYTSLTAQLFWAPNHALPLWLGALLIYRQRDSASLPGAVLVLLPLLLLWTPFALGLLPWATWALWQQRQSLPVRLRWPTRIQWAHALTLGVLLIAYLTRPGVESTPVAFGAAGSAASAGPSSWPAFDLVIAYVQFVAFEFGILALLLRPKPGAERQAFAIALCILTLLPLIRIGPSNDFMLRMSTPCIVVLLVVALNDIGRMDRSTAAWRMAAIAVAIICGMITPGFEIARGLLRSATLPNYGQTLVEAQQGYLAPHYIGRLDLPPLNALFKNPTQVPAGSARITR